MNVKELLLKQTHEAFSRDDEMSLKAGLADLTQEQASWRMNDTTWTIEEILYHVAMCKIEYCKQALSRLAMSRPCSRCSTSLRSIS